VLASQLDALQEALAQVRHRVGRALSRPLSGSRFQKESALTLSPCHALVFKRNHRSLCSFLCDPPPSPPLFPLSPPSLSCACVRACVSRACAPALWRRAVAQLSEERLADQRQLQALREREQHGTAARARSRATPLPRAAARHASPLPAAAVAARRPLARGARALEASARLQLILAPSAPCPVPPSPPLHPLPPRRPSAPPPSPPKPPRRARRATWAASRRS
jgi:hypothetical protein